MKTELINKPPKYCPACLSLLKKTIENGTVLYECSDCNTEMLEWETVGEYDKIQEEKKLALSKKQFLKFNKQIN